MKKGRRWDEDLSGRGKLIHHQELSGTFPLPLKWACEHESHFSLIYKGNVQKRTNILGLVWWANKINGGQWKREEAKCRKKKRCASSETVTSFQKFHKILIQVQVKKKTFVRLTLNLAKKLISNTQFQTKSSLNIYTLQSNFTTLLYAFIFNGNS